MLPADGRKIIDGLEEMKVFIERTAKMEEETKRWSEERWDSPESVRGNKMRFLSQLVLEAFVVAVKGKAPLASIVGMAATVTEEMFETAGEKGYLPPLQKNKKTEKEPG